MHFVFGKKRATSNDPLGEDRRVSREEESLFRLCLESYAQDKEERECLQRLHLFCMRNDIRLSDHLIFRFACCHEFEYRTARKALLANYNRPYISVALDDRISAFLQDTLCFYPLPGLRSKFGNSRVLFFRSPRYVPSPDNQKVCLESLNYVVHSMCEDEEECRNGITIVSYLEGFGMKNHDPDLGDETMRIFNGTSVPIKVNEILLVDAPKVVSRVLKLTRTFMTKSLRKKIKIIKSADLGEYLMDGFEEFLPNEMEAGWKNGAEIVEDFVDQKRFNESKDFDSADLVTTLEMYY